MADLVTRGDLRRALLLNALTKPSGILVGATVAVAAFVLGTAWLLVVALAVYAAMTAATFFDADEAERVGRDTYAAVGASQPERPLHPAALEPEAARLVGQARKERERIVRVVQDSGLPLHDVLAEVAALGDDVERLARAAHTLATYGREERLSGARSRLEQFEEDGATSPGTADARSAAAAALRERLAAADHLEAQYARHIAELEHSVAYLGVVHAEVVRMSVAGDARDPEDVRAKVRELRSRVGQLADSFSEP